MPLSRSSCWMTCASPGFLTPQARSFSWYRLSESTRQCGACSARAVDLQIAHHDVLFAAGAQVNERVGHKHASGVKHVGVMLAVGDHQQRLGRLHNSNTEQPVAGVAQPGQDVALLVQLRSMAAVKIGRAG